MGFRFSGHETFPCRYAWLPKAFDAISKDHNAFAHEGERCIGDVVGDFTVQWC